MHREQSQAPFDPVRRFRTCSLVAALGLAAACGTVLPNSEPPAAVIDAVLFVDHEQDTVFVHYSQSPNRPFGQGVPPEPVPNAEVRLSLEAIGGASVPVVPLAGEPGKFVATLRVDPGTDYRLAGTVLGRAVSGTVRTPPRLELLEPVGDTVFLPRTTRREVPYRLASIDGIARIISRQASVETDGTRGVLHILFGLPDTLTLTLIGQEVTAARYYAAPSDDQSPGNLTGARGVLGAATTVSRVFVWR